MKTTKKQIKESEARAALRQRVADIANGAAGYRFDTEDEFANADFLSRFIPALEVVFNSEEEGKKNAYLWAPSNLSNYDNVGSATDFLFTHGVRA